MKKYLLLPLLSVVLANAFVEDKKLEAESEDKLFTAQYLYTEKSTPYLLREESIPDIAVIQIKNNKKQKTKNIAIPWSRDSKNIFFNDSNLCEIKFSPGGSFLIAAYESFLRIRMGNTPLVNYDIYDIRSGYKLFSSILDYKISKTDQFFAIKSNCFNNIDIYRYSINSTVNKIKTFQRAMEYEFLTIEDNTFFWIKTFLQSPTLCYYDQSFEEELIDLTELVTA